MYRKQDINQTAFRVNAHPDFEVTTAIPLTGDLFDGHLFLVGHLEDSVADHFRCSFAHEFIEATIGRISSHGYDSSC